MTAVNAAATASNSKTKTNQSNATSTAAPRLKLVIRRLPPSLPEDIFWKSCERWVKEGETCLWRRYVKGKKMDENNQHPIFSRAYVLMNSAESVISFAQGFDGHAFRSKDGQEFRAVVEFAPSQKVPNMTMTKNKMATTITKTRTDARQGTIEEDAEYLKFLEQLAMSKEKMDLPTANGPVEVPTTTPLLDHLRELKQAKRSAQKHQQTTQQQQKQQQVIPKAILKRSNAGKIEGKNGKAAIGGKGGAEKVGKASSSASKGGTGDPLPAHRPDVKIKIGAGSAGGSSQGKAGKQPLPQQKGSHKGLAASSSGKTQAVKTTSSSSGTIKQPPVEIMKRPEKNQSMAEKSAQRSEGGRNTQAQQPTSSGRGHEKDVSGGPGSSRPPKGTGGGGSAGQGGVANKLLLAAISASTGPQRGHQRESSLRNRGKKEKEKDKRPEEKGGASASIPATKPSVSRNSTVPTAVASPVDSKGSGRGPRENKADDIPATASGVNKQGPEESGQGKKRTRTRTRKNKEPKTGGAEEGAAQIPKISEGDAGA